MFIQTSGFTISCSSLLVSFVGFDIGFSKVFFLSSIFAECWQPVGNLLVICRPTVGGGELLYSNSLPRSTEYKTFIM